MPNGDGITVRPADLVTHAGHLETVAGALTTAKEAGQAVRLDEGAYGKLCVIVPVLLGQLSSMVIDGIDAAANSMHDTADRLRTAADGYQSTDTRAQAAHDRVRGAL